MVVTLGQQYNVGEKPTVILYTFINRHAGTPKQLNYAARSLGSDGCQDYYIAILLAIKQITVIITIRFTRQEAKFCFLINIR